MNKKKVFINYVNKEGNIERIYERAFNAKDIGDFNMVIDENDPRYKLRKMIEEEEWERFRNKHKIPVAVYPEPEKRRQAIEEEMPLPYNPDLIVVPKDPKPKKIHVRERIAQLVDDVPRDSKMHFREGNRNAFINSLYDQAKNEDELNNLLLINEINLRHPRKIDQNGTPSKYGFCDDMGLFGINEHWMFNDFNKFGVGLGDYFRLLKWNVFFFFLCFIFGTSFLLVNYDTNNPDKSDIPYPDKLYGYSPLRDSFLKLTLGYFYRSFYMYEDTPVILDNETFFNYKFSCDTETSSKSDYYVYPTSIAQFNFIDQEEYNEKLPNLYNYSRNIAIKTKCEISRYIKGNTTCDDNNKNCESKINMTDVYYQGMLKGNCPTTYVRVQYLCYYKKNKKIERIYLGINITIYVLLFGSCYALHFLHNKSQKVQNENYYEIEQYTIHIKNAQISPTFPNLYIDLNKMTQAIINASMYQPVEEDEGNQDFFNFSPIYEPTLAIYQISYCPFDSSLLKTITDKYELLFKYEVPNYTNDKTNELTSPLANMKYNFNLHKGNKDDLLEQFSIYNNRIKDISIEDEKNLIDNVFFTFKTKMHAVKCYNCYHSKNCLYRMWVWITCKRDEIKGFYYKNKWLNVSYCPNSPDGYYYENFRIPRCSLCLNYFFSIFVPMILIMISIAIYYFAAIQIREFDEIYPNYINCEFIYSEKTYSISLNEIKDEYENVDWRKNRVLGLCYCKYLLFSNGTKAASEVYIDNNERGNIYICKPWLRQMDIVKEAHIGVYLMIAILNAITYYIMPFLSVIERHENVNIERRATMIRTFFYSFFANGFSCIIAYSQVSIKYKEDVPRSPFFTGNILPFNSVWFYYISSNITMNIFTCIITPYIIDYIKWLIIYLIRKFGLKDILREKNKYKFLYWFIGPSFYLEVKLGNLIGLLSICLLLNFTMLNPLIFLFLSILSITSFYLDKILFIRYCCNPKKYSQLLNRTYINFLYVITFFSLIFNVYICGVTYGKIPDAANIFSQLYLISRHLYFHTYSIFAGCFVVIPFFVACILPTCIYLTCKKCSIAFGFGEDKKFEKNAMEDFTIYESLPLTKLYKNYVTRTLEYADVCKQSLDYDLTDTLRFFRQRLDTDRLAIQKKISFLLKKNIPIDENFDEKIKLIIKRYEELEETKIQDNFSYNMSYFDLFQTLYLQKLLE